MSDEPQRVNFASGQLLSADDLRAEQEYHRRMRYRHNRLHGHGVVEGLEVVLDDEGVRVAPGWALDVLGREVVLVAVRELVASCDVDQVTADGARDVVITWAEVPDGRVPGSDGEDVFTRWLERPDVALVVPGTAAAESLVLGRISRGRRGRAVVETSGRRTLAPRRRAPTRSDDDR